jgi:signal peptidase I
MKTKIENAKRNYEDITVMKTLGASMKGKIAPGSTLAIKKNPEGVLYEVGDIIAYEIKGTGLKIIHEVIGIKENNGEIEYETKGVNNKQKDKYTVPHEDVLGKQVLFTKQELKYLIMLAEEGKIPYIKGLGLTTQTREKITLLKDLANIFYEATHNYHFNLEHNFARFNSFLTNDPKLQTIIENFKLNEKSDKALSQDLIMMMNWIYKLNYDAQTKSVNGYHGFGTLQNLESIKSDCLKKIGEFSKQTIISTDLLAIYEKYADHILDSPGVDLKFKVGILEIILGIETLKSRTDMKNKLGSYISEFATNPSLLDNFCENFWGNTYQELQIAHAHIDELTSNTLRNALKNSRDFANNKIGDYYDEISNYLIAISDNIKVVESTLDNDGNPQEIATYDIAYLTLGENDKSANNYGNNLVHLLARHFDGTGHIDSDLIQLGLQDHREVVKFIFDVISATTGVKHLFDTTHELQVAYKIEINGNTKYLCIGFETNGDKSIHTAFLANQDLTRQLNKLDVFNKIDSYNVNERWNN